MKNLDGYMEFAETVRADWGIPGLAIGIVKDDSIIFNEGFGLRNIPKNLKVTPDTLFAIGSCTKAFTTFAMGLLVEEGKLNWDTPVRNYLPSFRLKDMLASERITPRDLVTHRSGLPRHDLSWYIFKDSARQDLVNKLAHHEPSKDFRTTYQYNNLMYVTAGVIIETITGLAWETFIRERLLKPLGMDNTNFSVLESQRSPDHSLPYNKIKEIEEVPFYQNDIMGPCGSIDSSINDMLKWVRVHLNHGRINGSQIISESSLDQLHTPQIIAGSSKMFPELSHSLYGMGWSFNTYRGYPVMEHSGGIDGFISLVSFLPKQKIGLVILTNLTPNAATQVLAYNAFDRLLGLEPVDWNKRFLDLIATQESSIDAGRADSKSRCIQGTKPSHHLQEYLGSYMNPGYGELIITQTGDSLRMETNAESFPLTHHHYDVFNVNMERLDVNLPVIFATDADGLISSLTIPLEMNVSPIEFKRIADARMRDPDFLKQFTGIYQCVEFEQIKFTVLLKNEKTLTVGGSGQPDTELEPIRGTEFRIAEQPIASIEFVQDSHGQFTQLVLRKLESILHAVRL